MCGIKGELYPITRERFEQRYSVCNRRLDINFDYEPRVYNTANNEIRLIRDYIIPCTVRGTSNIFARKLARTTKIIYSERTAAENRYRYQNFLTGLNGDYLAVSENNTKDLYAISSDVFDTIYQKVE